MRYIIGFSAVIFLAFHFVPLTITPAPAVLIGGAVIVPLLTAALYRVFTIFGNN